MTMPILETIVAVALPFIGMQTGALIVARRKLREWRDTADALEASRSWHARKLHALRTNAYLTDERGVRVRYDKASAAVQAKAEA